MTTPLGARHLALFLGAAAVLTLTVAPRLWAQPESAKADADAAKVKAEIPAPMPIRGAKFDHDLHADGDQMPRVVVDSEKCTDCHTSDDTGKLTLPGTSGKQMLLEMPMCNRQRAKLTRSGNVSHQPCLDSGCHVDDFLNVGPRARQANTDDYRKAASFCLGCHAGDQPPEMGAAPTVGNIYCDNDSPDYHVEFNHLRHSEKTACRNCHVVGEDNALQLDRPNHVECATCHTGKEATPMSYCRTCHLAPGPSEYFKPREYNAVVRSCGSPEHLRRAARKGKQPSEVPCFKHETQAHRFKRDEPLQCSQCHYMISSRKYWDRRQKYESLRDIKSARLIDNRRDRAHEKACGGSRACHARDVDDSRGGSEKCTLCHPM